MLADLRAIYSRDIATIGREVAAYTTDAALWEPLEGTTNPGGTLALHLVGNLQHFIGTVLGGSDFVRDRDGEFGRRDLTRAELGAQVAQTADVVDRTLASLAPQRLAEEFPVVIAGRKLSTGRALLHLLAHLAYHLGQLDYHRRAVNGSGTVGAMGLDAL
ncbi:MAG: DinB family protein [Gemmatimonadaceae bacterium]